MEKVTNPNSPFFAGNKNKWFKPRGYYIHAYNNFDMTFHSHNRIELMYVATGELQIEYQNQSGEYIKHSLIPNNYVYVDANVRHKICINNVPTTIYNLEFSLTNSSDATFSINGISLKDPCVDEFFKQTDPVFICSDDGLILQNVLLLQKYLGNEISDFTDRYFDYSLSAMWVLLAKQYRNIKKQYFGVIYVNKAVKYIYENYNRDISLTDLANVCEISPNYLNTLFSKSFGHTVKEYVNKYRITRATLLLSGTNLSIEEVRVQVGYNNKTSFYQNFLKFAGKSPKKYRQELLNSNITKTHIEGSRNTYWNV